MRRRHQRARRLNPMINLADRIDAILPQTQCTQCGYPDCRRYAEAIAAGEAGINQCPPGGEAGIHQLAALTGRPVVPLNPVHGETKPFALALIDETHCIGCTLCIQACPVDAILGAAKLMHTVIAQECTGCELCIAPCPVDCISMVPASRPAEAEAQQAQAHHWRLRHQQRAARLVREKQERSARLAAKALDKLNDPHFAGAEQQASIRAALARNAQETTPAATINTDPAAARRAKLDEIMARAAARLDKASKE
ncbi:electron transport complex subunit RsxB [Chitinimonas sp. BJYL2]|uniref:electron transport complex subunit RsxB n=1 Tax=Chitinimonas sp. BJYL2 TaxID=2976696 RepID=UPI0022B51F53|nr:electron transport complex subunit RsxB [Chitinimonas sp. BJYL2]